MKKLGLITLLVLVSLYATAGSPRTGVLPDVITDQDQVIIGLANLLSPCIATSELDPTFYHLSDDNQITFAFVGIGINPCPNVPGFGLQYPTQPLSAGDYTLQVYIVPGPNSLPLTINDPLGTPYGDLVQFTVQGTDAGVVSVPTLGFLTKVSTVILFVLLGLVASLKRMNKNLFLSIVLLSPTLHAKEFILRISNDPQAPTAEEIVNQANLSPHPGIYPLDTFNQFQPETVNYYLRERPYGQRLDMINQYPNWTVSILYQYIVVNYDDVLDSNDLMLSFTNDPYVVNAGDISRLEATISTPQHLNNNIDEKQNQNSNVFGNFIGDFITDLDINMAWQLSEGMGYIAIIDSGVDIDHPAFRAFSDNDQYLGGNLLDGYYQLDLASGDLNVDEQEPFDTQGIESYEACDLADGNDDNLAISVIAGHGTHVSGIIGAKDNGFSGICKNCGIGMMKYIKYGSCIENFNPPTMAIIPDKSIIGTYLEILSSYGGFGTINWSGGLVEWNNDYTAIITDENFCVPPQFGVFEHEAFCNSLEVLRENNVMMVSAGGNNRVKIDFPASERETIAVAGVDQWGTFWNESPGPNGEFDFSNNNNCPFNGPMNECGSNISHSPIDQKIDVVTQARAVYSTFYPGGRWNDGLECNDASDGMPNDGYGLCRGTSMSTPQVAAIIQLMRSTNPLLPNGTYDPSLNTGLINILNSTSSGYLSGQGVSNYLGYGIPSASLALEKILGYSDGQLMRTRLTPMFSLYSAEAQNNIYSPFPQMGNAVLSQNGADYDSDNTAPLVNEFPEFWHGPNVQFPAPRAHFYVFTTNNNPFVNLKNMAPLRRMEKTINVDNRNDTYAINDAEIEAFHIDGYNYAGIEGYIFPTCQPEPGCIPFGAHKLYRVFDNISFNHTLVNLPINDPAPANSTKLGYVYPNVDTDGDGLIDGQELILGTNINVQDTDGDGMTDGEEYPPAAVPFSDPLISDIIFEDTFEQ